MYLFFEQRLIYRVHMFSVDLHTRTHILLHIHIYTHTWCRIMYQCIFYVKKKNILPTYLRSCSVYQTFRFFAHFPRHRVTSESVHRLNEEHVPHIQNTTLTCYTHHHHHHLHISDKYTYRVENNENTTNNNSIETKTTTTTTQNCYWTFRLKPRSLRKPPVWMRSRARVETQILYGSFNLTYYFLSSANFKESLLVYANPVLASAQAVASVCVCVWCTRFAHAILCCADAGRIYLYIFLGSYAHISTIRNFG